MSYQPYVTTGNNNNSQQSSTRRPQTTTNNYSYAPSTSGGAYAPAPAAAGYGSSTNSYAASRPPPTAPSQSYGTSSYGSSYGAPITTSTTSSALPDFSQSLNLPPPTTSPTPASSSNYGSSYSSSAPTAYGVATKATEPSYSGGYRTEAIATPVNNTGGYHSTYGDSDNKYGSHGAVAASALNSSTYSGGPTGGLISEGNPTICHKVDYEIKGHEMQLVEIELDPSETVIAEAGAMMFMDEGIEFKTKFGDGSTPKEGFFKKLLNAGGRLLMGESLFITHFTNQGQAKSRVAFAAPYPGTILPMNLQNLNGKLICQKDAFLCAAKGTKLSIHLNKKIGAGLFGGEGFILQKLEGDGMAFVHAGGMVIKRELRGEKLRIDTGCVVAFTDGINFDIQFVPGLKSMFFGGEGLFLATLQGTGTVWMQSLPFSRLADRIIQSAPSAGGRRTDEGSMLTGRTGDMINGDGFGFKF